MRVRRVPADNEFAASRPQAAYADAYRLIVNEPGLEAITAARRVMERPPVWSRGLMSLRNRIAVLFGLKPARRTLRDERVRFGSFPVICCAPERVVLGFDDKHLDFRIIVDVAKTGAAHSQITATTMVHPHNLLGQIYLAFVLPFHRMIVPPNACSSRADLRSNL